jgi:erythromycin esterase-like protein
MKHRLFRFLVQEQGFRAFAIESNWEAVERTNAYVQSCAGTPADAIKDEHLVWQSSEYAGMVQWMCQWNSVHPDPADRLTIFGFDIQQPERDGPALAALLGQFGVPATDARAVSRIPSARFRPRFTRPAWRLLQASSRFSRTTAPRSSPARPKRRSTSPCSV